jgi:uncharacterized RDD family membrane protein YckC
MTDDRFELPLFDRPEESGDADRASDNPVIVEPIHLDPLPPTDDPPAPTDAPQAAGVGPRLAAGFIDLLIHVALAATLVGGSNLLGAPIAQRHAVPLAIVLFLFSFLYHVVPLAFWGQTPGMAATDLRVRTLDDLPLSLPQATRRWLALLLTLATAGLGVLLALGGRSLADRLSGSQTLLR